MPASTIVTNQSKVLYPLGINLATATIKCALFTSTGVAPTASATTYSALTGTLTEVSSSGTGYTTGGNTVAGLTWTGTTTPQITGTIPQWYPVAFSYRYAVIYDSGTDDIFTIFDNGSDQTISSALSLSFDAVNGYLKISST